MRRLIPLAAGLVVALAPAAEASERTGRLLVTLEPGARATATAAAGARPAGLRVPELRLAVVAPAPGRTLEETRAVLARDPRVAAVEPERRHALRHVPDDPALRLIETAPGTPGGTPLQWSLHRSGFPRAWDVADGAGATVAVLDTGVDATHPELAGKLAGTVDVDATAGAGPPTVDEDGHGTHVASVACAAAGNAIGLAGAGLGCRLLVVKTDLTDGSIAAGIVAAVDRGADAISMSFGTSGRRPPARALVDALRHAHAHDVVLVAAAADAPVLEQGDPANVLQPTGTGPDLDAGLGLSVTAATAADARAAFAGRGTQVSLAAYGAFADAPTAGGPPGLLGAFPARPTRLEREGRAGRTALAGDTRYAYLRGTSVAAPQVAAAAALARDLNPDLSADEVIRLLKRTAHRHVEAWEPELGWGVLDAGAALEEAGTLDRRPPTSRLRAPRTSSGTVTLRWSGRDEAPPAVRASGISRVEVWHRRPGRRAARRIATTRASVLRVRLGPGRHAFFTRAVDRAGNREAAPARPDAQATGR